VPMNGADVFDDSEGHHKIERIVFEGK
jgi:hypothetical protein